MTINITLCATPYSYGVPFFFFETLEEYKEQHEKQLELYNCEEYEFQFIDGNETAYILWKAVHENMYDFFETLEELSLTEEDVIKLYVCTHIHGYTLEDAKNRYEDICLFNGTVKEYAYEIFPWELVPEHLHSFIDIDQYVTDLECNGDVFELEEFDYIVVR